MRAAPAVLGIGLVLLGMQGARGSSEAPSSVPRSEAQPSEAADVEAQSVEETDYALQCRGCHGPDGAGVAGRVPSLAGVAGLLRTPEGRARLLAVPGVQQASLSDARLAALLDWVARRFAPPGPPPAFAPLSAQEVGRYRGTSQTLR